MKPSLATALTLILLAVLFTLMESWADKKGYGKMTGCMRDVFVLIAIGMVVFWFVTGK